MVKHMILWQLNEEVENKEEVKNNAKKALEGLVGQVDGLVDLKIIIDGMPSSNADMMLDATLVDEKSLAGYQKHPLHVAAADTYVRPFTQNRMCIDFES